MIGVIVCCLLLVICCLCLFAACDYYCYCHCLFAVCTVIVIVCVCACHCLVDWLSFAVCEWCWSLFGIVTVCC